MKVVNNEPLPPIQHFNRNITIEFSPDEAFVLGAVAGLVGGRSEARNILGDLGKLIENYYRIDGMRDYCELYESISPSGAITFVDGFDWMNTLP